MTPEYMTKEKLLMVLGDIRERVAAGDSYEGNLVYAFPEEGDDPDGFRVMASYRIGNLRGQGGTRLFGTYE
jgi:hypothetical protein